MTSHVLRTIRPSRSGARVAVSAVLLALLAAAALSGCSKDGAQAAARGGAGHPGGPEGGPGGKPATPPTAVQVVRVEPASISDYYVSTATLEAERTAQVVARAEGPILKISHEEGDDVREGEPLLLIEDDPYAVRLLRAESTLKTEQSAYDRLKAMKEHGLASDEQLDIGESKYKLAVADRDLAGLELSYTKVAAPFSGMVTRRFADVGQTVAKGAPLFELADFRPLLAKVHVPAKEFGKLSQNQPVQLVLDSSRGTLQGSVMLVSPTIDATTGTIKVTVRVDEYPKGTRPGDFAEVRIVTETHAGALVVPSLAVFQDRGENIVYVADDSLAHRRPVETGFQDDKHTEILAGLTAGDRVVVKGQRSLRDGAPVKILDPDAPPTEAVSEAEKAEGEGAEDTGS